MRKKIIVLLVSIVSIMMFLNIVPVYACSPAPWSFEDAYKSKSMVYGKVIDTDKGGRKATLDVIRYVGPNQPPKRIYMPETVDDRDKYPAGNECPDFSMKFKEGKEYVFFLKDDVPPNLELLSPNYITASLVEDGQVTVGLPRGEKDSLHKRLQYFAQSKGYEIQSPNNASPVWGGNHSLLWGILVTVATCFILVYFYLKRFKKPVK